MCYRIVKWLRVALALCVITALTAYFLDLEQLLDKITPIVDSISEKSPKLGAALTKGNEYFATHAHWLAKIQFVPSFLAGSFAVFATLVVVTFLFGRIYCSVVCPLGIFQDVIAWFGRRFARCGKKRQAKKEAREKYEQALAKAEDPSTVKAPTPRKVPVRDYSYRKNPIAWRVGFLVLAIASIFCGGFFFGLIEPYGIFGRIAVNLFKPVYLFVNNKIWAYCESRELFQYSFFYVSIRPESVGALITGVVSFLALIVFAGRWGRLYCNSVCPVGTILGAISRFSIFKMKIDKSRCIKCGMCSKACKSSCIDFKNATIDTSRCVVCLECYDRCKKGALSYGLAGRVSVAPNETTATADSAAKSTALDSETLREKARLQREIAGFDRGKRQFLTLSTVAATAALAEIAFGRPQNGEDPQEFSQGSDSVAGATDLLEPPTEEAKPEDYGLKPFTREYTISPPGSISHKEFQNRCVGCHLCVAKCPQRILKPSGFENGPLGFMQPRVDFTHGFCNFDCTICGEVCPAGAIKPLTMEEKHLVQTGHVVFIKENCIVYAQDTSCGACSEHCPTQAIHMVPYKGTLTIPETDVSLCVGCGGCEYICPARPFRAVYIEGNPVHVQAEPVVSEEVKKVEEVDFGF